MASNIDKIILHILSVIDYKKDKEEYKNRLVSTFIDTAFIELFDSLPKDSQDEARSIFANSEKKEEVEEFLKKFYTEKEYTEMISNSIKKSLEKYIKKTSSFLSLNQKKEIIAFIQSLENQPMI